METKVHKFTVVKPASSSDKDVALFKAREAQAKKRAEARAHFEANAKTFAKKDGLVVRCTEAKASKSVMAQALIKALN
jgi:hypothetical protein